MKQYKETALEETESEFHCFKEVYRKIKVEIDGVTIEKSSWVYSYPKCQLGFVGFHKDNHEFSVCFNQKPTLEEVINKYASFCYELGINLMKKKTNYAIQV